MPIAQTGNPILEQTTNQPFVMHSLDMRQNELAGRVHQFCLPGWLRLTTGKPVPLIRLQFGHSHPVYFLFMILLSMFPYFLIQAAHRAGVYFDQSRRTLETAPIGQVFSHRYGLWLPNFTVPQRCVFAFAELLLTAPTTQVTKFVPTIHFSDDTEQL